VKSVAAAADDLDRPITVEIRPFDRVGNPALQAPSSTSSAVTDSGRQDDLATIQAAMPGLVAAALIPYRHIRIRPAAQELNAERQAQPAEFVLRGSVVLRGKEVVVSPTLFNRETGKSRRLGSAPLRVDRLGVEVDVLARRINAAIAEQKEIVVAQRAIVVACVRDPAQPNQPDLELTVQRGLPSLLRSLKVDTRSRPIKWSAAKREDCSPVDLAELAAKEAADAAIVLSPMPAATPVPEARAGVKWAVYINADNRRIAMPEVAFDRTKLILDDDELSGGEPGRECRAIGRAAGLLFHHGGIAGA
jgi:hypothetical protein